MGSALFGLPTAEEAGALEDGDALTDELASRCLAVAARRRVAVEAAVVLVARGAIAEIEKRRKLALRSSGSEAN